MHDTFEWWAYIWIPSLLGATTLAVAVVAVVVSRNASRLAEQIETSRVEDDHRRELAEARHRLIALAGTDARALRRYVVEWIRGRPIVGSRPINESAPPRSPFEAARVEAIVQLEQSLVPGALELLELTQFDLDNRREWLTEYARDEPREREIAREQIVNARDARTMDRIRDWGLDPEAALVALMRDHTLAFNDGENYLKICPLARA